MRRKDGAPRTRNQLEIIDPEAKLIPGFPGYYASKNGTIWSKHQAPGCGSNLARRRTPQRVERDYLAVRLKRPNGTYFGINVHRLVLLAWVGQPPEGKPYGCHNDGDINNCDLGNLRWDNARANAEDARTHGTLSVGSRHPISKLTEAEVLQIRLQHSRGETLRSLGILYNVGFITIRQIVKRNTWKHI